MLFENKVRTLQGGIPHGMGAFDYLDQSDRLEAARVRAQLNGMLDRCNMDHAIALAGRLRSVEPNAHDSAYFELFLHELLVVRGYTVVEVEPTIPGTSKHPDFLVQAASGEQFYLEAVTVSGHSREDEKALARRDSIRRALDEIVHDQFLLLLHESRPPGIQVRTSRFRRMVRAWLDELSITDVSSTNMQASGLQRNFAVGDTHVVITAQRRKNQLRTPVRGLGAISHGVRIHSMPHERVALSVKAKAGRYGALGLPYFVAVNSLDEHLDDEDFDDALFGSLAMVSSHRGNGYTDRITRLPDGVFMGRSGPTYTRLTGAICFSRVQPWRTEQCSGRVIENPHAAKIMPLDPLGLPLSRLVDKRMKSIPGDSPGQLLGLPPGWPE